MTRFLLIFSCFWIFSVTAVFSANAAAQTVYVSDIVYVPVRSGPGNQYRIVHQGIRTGTQMTLLEVSEDKEWTKIRTEGGLEGWMGSQHILREQPARMKLAATEAKLTASTTRIQELENELKQLRAEHSNLVRASNSLTSEKDQYAEELRKIRALSADAVNLNQRYQDLLEKHELIQTEFDAVQAENDQLKANQTINQWMFGAGLVILGMILMLILPAFARQKRHSDWVN